MIDVTSNAKEVILSNLPPEISGQLQNVSFLNLEEVRLRAGRELVLFGCGKSTALPYTVSAAQIEQSLRLISNASVYAHIEEIKNCFITLEGGHRVGICGRVIFDGGKISNIVQPSGLNYRIAREVKGAANKIMRYIANSSLKNTLIVSPPQCGKTTILRDIARQLGQQHKVCIIDERGEIAAMRGGVPQLDIGRFTDVLDLCPKAIGIPLALRSMSPDVIITDEIAHCDIHSIGQALSCGVKIIATAHGDNKAQVGKRLCSVKAMEEFDCFITLSRRNGVGTIESIG